MSYKYKEYVAKDDNGEVVSSVNVYVVTEDHDGENVQTTGGIQQVHTGDVLVQSPNPNYHDVLSADVWDGLGYTDATEQSAPAAPVEPAPADPSADPQP
jgi:hypothetical protein